MLKAVIFDMDGVLVDSEPLHYKSNCITLEELCGIHLDYEYYKQFIGTTVAKMWNIILPDFKIVDYSPKDMMEHNDRVLQELLAKEGYPPVKGAAECVKELKKQGYLLAVASSSKREKIEENLKNLGILDCFETIVSGMELQNPKPAPDIFQKAAEQLHVTPEECLVIEDSGNGVRAAVAAGMPCAAYLNPNSGDQDLSLADYLFEDFESTDEAFWRMVHNHHFKEA